MFSHLKRSPAELASSKTDTDRRLAVVIGSDPQFDDLVVNKARDLYAKLLRSGRCRTSTRRLRIDHGRKGLKERPGSKQAWMRARKQAVDQAAQEEAEIRTPRRRPPVELPESLAKEAAKQDQLAKKRKAEAFLEGTLLESEITPEVRTEAAKRLKTDAANDKDRRKKFLEITKLVKLTQEGQTRQWALQALPEPACLLGLDRDATLTGQLRAAGVTSVVQDDIGQGFYLISLKSKKITLRQDLKLAKLLVFDGDMACLARSHRLFAALMGCVALNASVLRGAGGCKLAFKRGLTHKVRVFASEAFKREAPGLTLIVREACARKEGWRAVPLEEARRKDGWKWGLILRGATESLPGGRGSKKLLSLTGDELVAWATREFTIPTQSAWVNGP